jgi:formylglycine-generating enzyme required for sulfatase activity
MDPQTCPAQEKLAAFAASNLCGDPLEEAIGAHVDACPTCQAFLKALPPDEKLSTSLGGPKLAEPFLDEPACARAVAKWAEPPPLPPGTPFWEQSQPHFSVPTPLPRETSGPGARYVIEGFFDEGALGKVYLGKDRELDREVALKHIQQKWAEDPDCRRRLVSEAKITGSLEHAGVVPVYGLVQNADGLPGYAMRFIRGERLQDALDRFHAAERPNRDPGERTLALHQLLSQFVAVCKTVAYAHSQGVIHRDLKPRNIMLGPYGETLVVDWGFAKRLRRGGAAPGAGEETAVPGSDLGGSGEDTAAGRAVGTPGYISPEAAAGRWDVVGPPTDIFSLGATLYAILTGRAPFQGSSKREVLDRALRGDFPPPPQGKNIPLALLAIARKAMARRPEDRYDTALDLASEVERWLADEPVQAYPEGWPARLGRWVKRRRKPLAASLAAAAGLLLVFGWLARDHAGAVKAEALVRGLADAEPGKVEELIKEIEPYRRWANPLLEHMAGAANADRRARLHASLALVRVDPGQLEYLKRHLLEEASPEEVLLIQNALRERGPELAGDFWIILANPASPSRQRLRAACALAVLAPGDKRWDGAGGHVVTALMEEENVVLRLGVWTDALRNVKGPLTRPLEQVFRDAERPESKREVATTLLVDYAADEPLVLTRLICDAEPWQYGALLKKLNVHEKAAVPLLEELVKQAWPPAENEREQQARRQANAAVTLLQLGEPDQVWPLLKHGPDSDPRRRSYVIHRLGALKADPAAILKRLQARPAPDVSERRALLLALGGFPLDQLKGQQEKLIPSLLETFKNDPDPGVHGATEWLLRKWDYKEDLQLAMNQLLADSKASGDRLAKIQRELDPAHPRWFVNGQGQTFVVLPGPVTFRMGSRDPRWAKESGYKTVMEQRHYELIGRSFAILTKEVTVAQFKRFNREDKFVNEVYAPTGEHPVNKLPWDVAAEYCNWLSKQEGLDPCYEFTKDKGWHPKPGHLNMTGYRIPTEAEWEYACRAGAVTIRFFGETEELMPEYVWYGKNSADGLKPVGGRMPNDFGLFDMLGNAGEWCENQMEPYPKTLDRDHPHEDTGDTAPLEDNKARVVRGGCFLFQPALVRCASRFAFPPRMPGNFFGLRPVRTVR